MRTWHHHHHPTKNQTLHVVSVAIPTRMQSTNVQNVDYPIAVSNVAKSTNKKGPPAQEPQQLLQS